MRRTIAGALPVAFALLATAASAADSPREPARIVTDDVVYDHSQVEWTEAYLQWIATFARGSSPVSDSTGALCGVKQEGDVWFLATSDGTAPVERSCAIPAGKTVLVPLATTVERSGNKEPVCESMARLASGSLTHVSELAMTIDGVAVDNMPSHRIPTGDCFALGARQFPPVRAKTAVADGWYVMLAPLPAGPHQIVVSWRYDGTPLTTTYRLDQR